MNRTVAYFLHLALIELRRAERFRHIPSIRRNATALARLFIERARTEFAAIKGN